MHRALARGVRRVAAVGEAVANLYPDVSISGFVGWQSGKIAGLINGDHSTYSYAPALKLPFFHWNQLMNTVNEQKEVKAQEKQTSSAEKDSGGKKVIIKKLSIKDGEINAIVGKEEAISVKLPAITMTNIGDNQKGESIAGTISKILNKILTTASNTVVKSKISDLKGVAEKNLEDITGGVKDRIKSIGIFGK